MLALKFDASTLRMDEPVRFRVDAARPGSLVRVTVSGVLPVWNVAVTTTAEFRANNLGSIDPQSDPSEGGDYEGVDPYGLWTRGVVDPRPTTPTDEWNVMVESAGESVSEVVRRELSAPDIRVDRVNDDGLVGLYARPSAGHRVPGVLMLGGSGATLESYVSIVAPLLASHGFAVLGVSYFGVPGLPSGFARIEVEYLEKALDWLRSAPEVRGSRVAVWGYSIGSGGALLLATERLDVAAVVSLGGAISNASVGPGSGGDVAPWTHRGEPAPFTAFTGEASRLMNEAHEERPVRVGPVYDAVGRIRGESAEFPIERVKARVLVISGGDDQMAGSRGPRRIVERARERATSLEVTHVELRGAGHTAIGFPPGIPTVLVGYIAGIPYAMGGTPAANSRAQAKWWPTATAFLRTTLGSD